jgi:hypothetical protein
MGISAGQDIEAICNKCGDVWHVVVAMVGEKVAKVQCKECNAYHKYRAPKGAKSKAKAVTRRKTSSKKSSSSKTKKKDGVKPPHALVEPDPKKPIREYGVRETFEVAERVDHPKFGVGVVEASLDGKIEVYFPVGRKVLAQAKSQNKLERPGRFEH